MIPQEALAAGSSRVIHFRAGAQSDTGLTEQVKLFNMTSKQSGRADLTAQCDRIKVARRSFKNNEIYDVVEIDGGTLGRAEIGDPDLPVYTKAIRIPGGTQPRLVVDQVVFADVKGSFEIGPVQEPLLDSVGFDESSIPFRKNKKAYARDGFGIEPVVELVKTFRVRGREYALVEFRPVQNNPVKKTLRVATDAEWHIEYTPVPAKARRRDRQPAPWTDGLDIRSEEDASVEDADVPIDSLEEEDVSTGEESTASSETTLLLDGGASSAQDCDYLIICDDDFKEEIQPLADWRMRTGLKVYVAGYPSEVGSGDTNIFNYIKTAYINGEMTRYVLIVGDHDIVPSYEIIGHPSIQTNHVWHTDIKYSCVDGPDDSPDLAIGRFPSDTEAQVTLLVNKVLTYDKNPPAGDWIKHMVGASDDEETRNFVECIHHVCDFMGGDFDFYGSWNGDYSQFDDPDDPFNKGYKTHVAVDGYPDPYWYPYMVEVFSKRLLPPPETPASWKANGTNGATQISGWINDGVGFVMHRDHGNVVGWGTPRYQTDHVNALTNQQKTPVVFSINCASGCFDYWSGDDHFAEAWLSNENGGAVAYFGHQRDSSTSMNNTLHVGIMDSIWSDYSTAWDSDTYPHSRRLGELNNYARDASGYESQNDYYRYFAKMFHLLGDPATELRTEIPQLLDATHPLSLTSGQESNFTVHVTSSGGNVEGATVCLADSNEQYVATTDSDGIASFSIIPDGSDAMKVTVTDTDTLPYLSSMNKDGDNNTRPVAYSQSVTTPESVLKAITLSGSDSDGDALTYELRTFPAHGSLLGSESNWTYTPEENYVGEDSFVFRVIDSSGATSAYAFISIDVLESTVAAFNLSAEVATEGAGILTNAGSVFLVEAVDSDTTVMLFSSDISEVRVTNSVVVPAGQISVDFDVEIVDDTSLDGSQEVVVFANANSSHTDRDTIFVHDNELASLSISPLPEYTVEGDAPFANTMMVSPAPDEDVLVLLESSDPSQILSTNIVVFSGQNSASFELQAVDDNLIDGDQIVTITAHVENWNDDSGTIVVNDNERTALGVYFLTPEGAGRQRFYEGEGVVTNGAVAAFVTGAITISNTPINLASSDTSELWVTNSVIIPEGQSFVYFDITVVEDSEYDGSQAVSVNAVAPGCISLIHGRGTVYDSAHHFTLEQEAGQQVAGTPFSLNIAARSIDNFPAFISGSVSVRAVGSDTWPIPVTPSNVTGFEGELYNYFLWLGSSSRWSGPVTLTHGYSTDDYVRLIVDDGKGHYGTGTVFNVVQLKPIPYYPEWWINKGVAESGSISSNDYVAVNQGQFKYIATQAYNEFTNRLAELDLSAISNVVSSFSSSNNYSAVNLGQLKYVAQPFYDVLWTNGITNAWPIGMEVGPYPWPDQSVDTDDNAIVNLGQLKYVFSFDLDYDSEAARHARE